MVRRGRLPYSHARRNSRVVYRTENQVTVENQFTRPLVSSKPSPAGGATPSRLVAVSLGRRGQFLPGPRVRADFDIAMSRATPEMRRFARCLIVCETTGNNPAATTAPTAFPVPEKLRQPLTVLMGGGGFQALLARALALATAEVRWLRTLQVKSDGTLEGVEALHARIDPAEFREGRVELLAQLLGLLVAFIGSNLTLRLVGEIWPQVLRNDLELDNGGKNEKTK